MGEITSAIRFLGCFKDSADIKAQEITVRQRGDSLYVFPLDFGLQRRDLRFKFANAANPATVPVKSSALSGFRVSFAAAARVTA